MSLDLEDRYALRRPDRSDQAALRDFSRLVWPDVSDTVLLRRWWWATSPEPQCWIAEDKVTSEIAALCAARSVRFAVGSDAVQAISICDWNVSPQHGGRRLGRRLVELATAGAEVCYTTSISESAATAFTKLSWTNDAAVPIHVGSPYLTIGLCRSRATGILVETGDARSILGARRHCFDGLWHRARTPGYVGLIRDGVFLLQHVSLSPSRPYLMAVASSGTELLGYLLFRILPHRSLRRLPWMRVGLLVDLLQMPDSGAAEALIGAVATYLARRRVPVCAILATDPELCRLLPRLGCYSAEQRLLSRLLAGTHTRCMCRSELSLPPFLEGWHLSFCDNDMDLVFGASTEA